MPLYEYQCDACGHRFERIQKFSDQLESTCPECGGLVRKLLSSPAIQFKGSGWYITDYARKDAASKTPASADSKGDGSKESTGDTSKSETKSSSGDGPSDTSKSSSSSPGKSSGKSSTTGS